MSNRNVDISHMHKMETIFEPIVRIFSGKIFRSSEKGGEQA